MGETYNDNEQGSRLSMVEEPAARYYKARHGMSKSEFLAIVASTGMTLTVFSGLLPVSKRTIEKVKDQELLSAQVSDRVLQIESLYRFGTIILESTQALNEWLHVPLLALGGNKPFDFMDNETGLSMIKDLLGRIEHGVYS